MANKTKTVAETVDFENDDVACVAGLVDDEISKTQRVVGIPAPMVRTSTVVKLGSGVHVSVSFNRKYSGKLWMREAANGSAYVWADVTIIEFPTEKLERSASIERADYRPFFNKKDGTWAMSEGARVHLNIDREGMLVRNSAGTFAPENNGVIACNQGRSKIVEFIDRSSYTKFLTTKHWDGDALVPDATFQRVFDVDSYNERLARTVKHIETVTIKKLMAKLPEDASDKLVDAAQAKAEHLAHARAERIIPRLLPGMKKRSYKMAHVLKMEGFRVFRYIKDTGIELSTGLPTDKKEIYTCPTCAETNHNIRLTDNGGWYCSYGHTGDETLKPQIKNVPRYAKDEDNPYRQLADVAQDVVKALEVALYNASGQNPSKRAFNGTCSTCSSCKSRIYGQNQDPIQVVCSKSMRPDMVMDEHWEQDLKDVVFGNYLMNSSTPDESVGLYGAPRKITFDKRGPKGHFNRKLEKAHTSMIPVLKGEAVQPYVEPSIRQMDDNKVSGGIRWIEKEGSTSTIDHALLHADSVGRAGYEVPSWLTFEKLSLMYHTFNMSLVQDLIGDREFESARERYSVTTRTIRGLSGDYLPINLFDAFLQMLEEDAQYNMVENDIEADAVASPEDFANILNAAHPLFKSIVLEEGATRELHAMYPTVYRDMQEFVRSESNPRMKKAGTSEDLLMAMYDDEGCIEYTRKWDPEAEVYGVANFAASNEIHVRNMAPVYAKIGARREKSPLVTGFGDGPSRKIPSVEIDHDKRGLSGQQLPHRVAPSKTTVTYEVIGGVLRPVIS